MHTDGNITYSVRDLRFSYGKNEVLKGASFDIRSGIITTLIGANGCGKTTLFNLLTKNLVPGGGKISFCNRPLSEIRLKDFAKKAAIVHQYNTVPSDLTVEKLVSYGRTPHHTFGLSKNAEEDREIITRAMEITGTLKHRDKLVSQLSGGQKQRVWIAMALAQDTDVLFLDEPTTYLDIRYQLQILRLIKRLNRDFGITVIMVLHDINQSLYYSDEIIAMKDGKISAQGNPKEIIGQQLIHDIYGVDLKVTSVDGDPFIIPV